MINPFSEEMLGHNRRLELFEQVLQLDPIAKPGSDRETTDQLIQQLVNIDDGQPIDQETGLTAFLISDLLWQKPDLESSLKDRIESMRRQAIKTHPFLTHLDLVEQALIVTLEEFCHQAVLPTTYFQLNLVDHPKAQEILAFICHQTAARYQQEYPRWLFKTYQHPEKKIPGIWMSQTGRHYNEKALLKMEGPTPRKVLNRTPFVQ